MRTWSPAPFIDRYGLHMDVVPRWPGRIAARQGITTARKGLEAATPKPATGH